MPIKGPIRLPVAGANFPTAGQLPLTDMMAIVGATKVYVLP